MTTGNPALDHGERLQAVFRRAVLLPDGARAAFLADACRGVPDLQDEVEALLAADGAVASEGDLPDADQNELAGRAVGPYRLVRLLGRGGMGSVYLARRDDVDKEVAVKLLDGPFSPDAIRRFLTERRVLARFDHPHIARLLDAGIVPPATPYFVMEYVDGEEVTSYAERVDLDTRLRLFEDVCSAVAYAHQHLVVHRDLKPSNIMVDRTGAVTLLDFGIAKLLDEVEDLTGTGIRLMTPECAAPEQVRGEPITAATDVYALGLLLFELLTGTRPYTLRGLTPAQAERTVCISNPARPSSVAPRVTRDLDAICLRAIEKDAARRYPTAAELRADVQRYRERRPVEARTPTRAYVLGKFLARHHAAVLTTAVLGLLLLGGSMAVLWQAQRADRERHRAERALAESEAVADFLIALFEARDPAQSRGADPPASELIARGEARAGQLARQPLVHARMLDTIGRIHATLGRPERAGPLMRRALAARQTHLPAGHADIATSLQHLATLHQEQGRYMDAEPLYTAAIEMRRRALGPDHPDLAESLSLYGVFVLRMHRDDRRAEALLREAVDIRRRAFGHDDPRVAVTLKALATVHDFRRQYEASERLLREALAMQRRHLGRSHPDSIATLSSLGATLIFKGDYRTAEPVVRETLALNREVFGPSHRNIALALNNLGTIFEKSGRTVKAEAAYREAAGIAETTLGPRHPVVAQMWSNHAGMLIALEAFHEAETLLTRSADVLRKTYGASHAHVRTVEQQLARVKDAPALR
jgi:serine/threonine-protein kinase